MAKAKDSGGRLVYIGPGFRGVARGTIYRNGLPDYLLQEIKGIPAIQELLVEVKDLPEAYKDLRDPESRLARFYAYVAKIKGKEAANGV